MLTLFKPWRHGKDLKGDDKTWDETFLDYKFTSRQTELMKFFNIHYECNDARNDYSALLKQKNITNGVFPHWFSSPIMMETLSVITVMMRLTSRLMKSMKWINTLPLEKGGIKE